MALRAGVDVDITAEPAYMGPLIENVREGKVPEVLVDRAVRRVLELKFRLGLFEHSVCGRGNGRTSSIPPSISARAQDGARGNRAAEE